MALLLALEGEGPLSEEARTASLCRHFAGRLPSEIEAEPLLPMLQTIEMQQVADAWLAFRHKPDDVKIEDLQKRMPLMDRVLELYSPVMAEIKRRRALRRAASARGGERS